MFPDERLSVQLAPGEKYRVPLGMPLPLPVKLTFMVGRPHKPPPENAPESRLIAFRDGLEAAVHHLLIRACHA